MMVELGWETKSRQKFGEIRARLSRQTRGVPSIEFSLKTGGGDAVKERGRNICRVGFCTDSRVPERTLYRSVHRPFERTSPLKDIGSHSQGLHDLGHRVQWILGLLLDHVLCGFTVLILHRRIGANREQGLHRSRTAIPWWEIREAKRRVSLAPGRIRQLTAERAQRRFIEITYRMQKSEPCFRRYQSHLCPPHSR